MSSLLIAGNARAEGLYRRCGYQWTGQQVIDGSSGRVEHRLRKPLP
ncbi:hypothetical protein [Glutamicibacter sp. 2E12]